MNYTYGTNGDDIMFATRGPDIIIGRQGYDSMHGLTGKDIFVLDSTDIKKFIIDFEDGRDIVDLREQGVSSFRELILLYEYDTDIVESTAGPMRLYLNLMGDPDGRVSIDKTDFIFTSTPVREYSSGRDVVELTQNRYSVHLGNGGNDALSLRQLYDAGDGPSHVWMDPGRYGTGKFEVGGVTQHFFEFRDIQGTRARDVIVADGQNNFLFGRGGSDSIWGRAGHDRIYGAAGNDKIFAGSGNDKLVGASGADLLHGGSGADLLVGGTGVDRMWGDAGADTFKFIASDHAMDRVMDFQDGIDHLDVSAWGADARNDLTFTNNRDGSVTVEHAHGDQSFIVYARDGSDLKPWDLSAGDFVFA